MTFLITVRFAVHLECDVFANPRFFPTLLVVLDVCAAIPYVCRGDWRRAPSWLFAAGLTVVVKY